MEELIELVNFRIAGSGLVQVHGDNGDVTYAKKSVYDRADVVNALMLSLSAFNAIPYFTNITFEDNVSSISDLLVTYACYLLLQRQALIEKGREFIVQNGGISFTPPAMGDFLFNVSADMHQKWTLQVQLLKKSSEFIESLKKQYN